MNDIPTEVINEVKIEGVISKEPIAKLAASGIYWASWSIAVPTSRGKSKSYFTCKAFGDVAEEFGKLAKKDATICIKGHLQSGSYTNRDGHKVYTTDIVADSIDYSKGLRPDAIDVQASIPSGFKLDDDIPF